MTRPTRLRVLLLAFAGATLLALLHWPEAAEREWSPNPNYLPDRLKPEALAAAAEARATAPPGAPYSDTLVKRALRPPTGWHSATIIEGEMTAPSDPGHGVLYPGPAFYEASGFPRGDTIHFRALPDTSSSIVGTFALVMEGSGSFVRQAVWAPQPLTGNGVEISVDDTGTPFDSVDASGRWRRAILGFTSTEQPQYGWTLLGDSLLRRMLWKESSSRGICRRTAVPITTGYAPSTRLAARGRSTSRAAARRAVVRARGPGRGHHA